MIEIAKMNTAALSQPSFVLHKVKESITGLDNKKLHMFNAVQSAVLNALVTHSAIGAISRGYNEVKAN